MVSLIFYYTDPVYLCSYKTPPTTNQLLLPGNLLTHSDNAKIIRETKLRMFVNYDIYNILLI